MASRLSLDWLSYRPHWLLAACLMALHLGLVQGPGNGVGRMLLLAHFGLFLLWQPLVQGGHRFGLRGVLVLMGVALSVALGASWGVAALWLMALASLVAGGGFFESHPLGRWIYRLAMVYLILALALLVLPNLLPDAALEVEGLKTLRVCVLPLLVLGLILLPVPAAPPREVGAFDLLSALLVFLVLAVIVLGAMAFMWLDQRGYLESLVWALFAMAGALLLLAWVWNPHLGSEGLGLKFSRRVLAAGVSFDDWLHDVADLALAEQPPLAFLAQACGTLTRFPGVQGGRGEVDGQHFEFGQPEGADYLVTQGGLRVHLAVRRVPSGAMAWYLNLAAQVIQEFYREKVLARRLQTLSYLEAVHQTGARLTHDVKNLLQSLEALCFVASRPEAGADQIQALVQRQLPVVAQRLRQTLDKLREPGLPDSALAPLTQWWGDVQARHRSAAITFVAGRWEGAQEVPLSVFHSVVDNLIQNALDKGVATPGLTVQVIVQCDPLPVVTVADDGEPVPADLLPALFREPLRSENGLGMGLYQSAQLARQVGYELSLEDNRVGRVRFRLAQAAPLAARAPES